MNLDKQYTVKEIASILNREFEGNSNILIYGINEIHRVRNGDLTFTDVEKYYKAALESMASVIIINKSIPVPDNKAIILSEEPFTDYNKLTNFFIPTIPIFTSNEPFLNETVRIGKHTVFGDNVILEDNVQIGHNVVIGNHVKIGKNTKIHANVVIDNYVSIGNNCEIKSGAIIGSDAFYYKKRPDRKEKMLSKGTVEIGNFVDIGANTTIDKGVSDKTIIGDYTKIDNLVQIGHDTIIGERCIIASQVGIAGVTTIESDVTIWGQVGIPSNVVIGKGAVIYAKSGVISSLEGNKTYFGFIAGDWKRKWREYACAERLPEIIKKLEVDKII